MNASILRFRYSLAFAVVATLAIFLGCTAKKEGAKEAPAPAGGEPAKTEGEKTSDVDANSSSRTVAATESASADGATVGRDPDPNSLTTKTEADEASEPALGIGDPAPELAVASWVKGEPLGQFEPGQTYVVEFWATWCGPCKMSMPHLSELQTQYGEKVKFVGVSDEKEDVVREFLKMDQAEGKTWDEVVSYSLAMDDENSSTNERYMRAAEQGGIPTAFVVGKDGHIEWIGHPMEIEEPLEKVVAGSWDRETAKAEMIAQKKMMERMRKLQVEMQAATENKEWDKAIGILDEMTKGMPADQPAIQLTRASFLRQGGHDSEATKIIDEIREKHWDDSMTLNELAWRLAADMGGVELDLALKAALRADELTEGKDASIQDTVARVYYQLEQLDDAIAWQQKAVDNATGGDQNLKATLEKYTAEKSARSNPEPADGATKEEVEEQEPVGSST